MRLGDFVVYLKENPQLFCEIECWDLSKYYWGFPCEFIELQKNYKRMLLLFNSLWFYQELMEIYHKHFLKEKKDNSFVCNIM